MINRLLTFCVSLLMVIQTLASDYCYIDGIGLRYAWSVDYRTSITSGKANSGQRAFYVTTVNADDNSYATVNAPGYKLSENSTYYCYHPYKWYDDFDATAIKNNYSGQVQIGNDKASGLIKHDLCIGKVSPSDAGKAIEYSHIGGVIRVKVESLFSGSVSRVVLKTNTSCIPESATVNLLTGEVSYDDYVDEISMEIKDVNLEEGQPIIAYIMMPSVDLSNQSLQLSVEDESGNEYVYPSVYGPNIEPGKLYNIQTVNMTSRKVMSDSKNAQALDTFEFPTVHTKDIKTDNEYAGILDLATIVGSISDKYNNIRDCFDVTGKKAASSHGVIISINKDGSIVKKIRK